MKLPLGCLALAYLSMVSSVSAQTTGGNIANPTTAIQASVQSAAATSQVPRLVKFSGAVQNFNAEEAGAAAVARDSASVPTNVVGITFSLYSQQTGGGPLWSEVQNVRVDSTGHYTVQLGSTQADGLPVELFSSAQAQWLGVRQEGQAEQSRIMLLSVPYALKAADAETFGGKPPSAFMSASNSAMASGSGGTTPGTNGKQPLPPQVDGGGTTNYIALWTSASDLGDSVMYQSSNNIGIGTTSPGYPLTVSGNNAGTIISVTQAGSGIGVNAYSYSTSGGGTAVLGKTQGNSGIGVRGDALASTGPTYGVYGSNASTSGYGVYGNASATTGNTYGVYGKVASTAGTALLGLATASSGNTIGVSGIVDSAAGTAGVFNNATGGNILVGQNNGIAKFTVDGSGDVNISGNFTGSGSGLTGIPFSSLSGTLGSSQLSGVYTQALTFSNTSNEYYGNGSNLTGVIAQIGPGSPYYIQNGTAEQTSADFNIDGDGSIGGDLQVDGDGTVGGTFQANVINVPSEPDGDYQVAGVDALGGDADSISVGSTQAEAFFQPILNNNLTDCNIDCGSVLIDVQTGQLGYYYSGDAKDARKKHRSIENIGDMGIASSKLFQLRPVTFFYSPQHDDSKQHLLQYGLIAGEVAKVYPELVSYDKDGQPYSVKYQNLLPMLLNEVQKQHATIVSQQDLIQTLQNEIRRQDEQFEQRLSRLEALSGPQR